MLEVRAEQLVFLDESIFKEQTGWRCMAYAPIAHLARWPDDLTMGKTWSILPAYIIDGYLPCTGIREGYYKREDFIARLQDELLPHCNPYLGPRSVISLDNLDIHLGGRVQEILEEAGCIVKFPPPYLPDYSSIELTCSGLKAWMRRHFRRVWRGFHGNFGAFLQYAIDQSHCD